MRRSAYLAACATVESFSARVFACLSGEPDFEYALVDGTIVTAHHKASGAKGGPEARPSAAPAAA